MAAEVAEVEVAAVEVAEVEVAAVAAVTFEGGIAVAAALEEMIREGTSGAAVNRVGEVLVTVVVATTEDTLQEAVAIREATMHPEGDFIAMEVATVVGFSGAR